MTFVRASRLYDVETGERVSWDWSNGQLPGERQTDVERETAAALSDVNQEG